MHDVKAFFESYREIWERTRDGRQIAEFYHAPTLSLRGDGSFVCLQTADEIVQFFQSAADNYHKQGWERWALRISPRSRSGHEARSRRCAGKHLVRMER
jgi:hypothetical protein